MVRHSMPNLLLLVLFVSPALAQDGAGKPASLHLSSTRLHGFRGEQFSASIHVDGGMPPYTATTFPAFPGLSVVLTGSTLQIDGVCNSGNRTDFINVADNSVQEVRRISFFCDREPVSSHEESSHEEPITEYKSFLGLQQSQSSSSDRTWKLFGNFGASFRVRRSTRFVLELDATSVPQQVGFKVSDAATQGPALVKNLKVNEAVQSLNMLAGFEFDNIVPGSPLAIKPIVLGGFSTPLSPKESVSIYQSTQSAFDTLGIKASPATYPYLALTTPDRSRFYAQWYGGFRMKTFDFFKPKDSTYPGYFDITFGQNSAVTGGQLRHFVSRFSGYVPITGTPFAIFGSAYIGLMKNTNSNPLFLSPADPSITVSNQQVYNYPKAENRDFYQIGVGMDLVSVAKRVPQFMKIISGQ